VFFIVISKPRISCVAKSVRAKPRICLVRCRVTGAVYDFNQSNHIHNMLQIEDSLAPNSIVLEMATENGTS